MPMLSLALAITSGATLLAWIIGWLRTGRMSLGAGKSVCILGAIFVGSLDGAPSLPSGVGVVLQVFALLLFAVGSYVFAKPNTVSNHV